MYENASVRVVYGYDGEGVKVMEKPVVSVIVPIYNVEEYLDDCVDSVCKQTYENIEIILVDDGSTDSCPQKCDEWATKDLRIKVLHKKNGGLSEARNAGLDITTGEYVCFLDGDDSIVPKYLETIVPYMVNGADMVIFNFQRIFADGTIGKESIHENGVFKLADEKSRYDFLIEKVLMGKVGWEACTRVFRHSKIEKYALRFEDNERIFAEDLYFCLCYVAHAEKIVSIPDTLYNYFFRSDSIMANNLKRLNVGRMNELSKSVQEFLCKWKDCALLIDDFSLVHFLIIENVMNRGIRVLDECDVISLRNIILSDISDIYFFEKQVKGYLKIRKKLICLFSPLIAYEKLNFYFFLLDGKKRKWRLCNKIIYKMFK